MRAKIRCFVCLTKGAHEEMLRQAGLGSRVSLYVLFAAIAVLIAGLTKLPVLSQESKPALRGLAQSGTITAAVAEIRPVLLSACRGHSIRCMRVHIKNNTDQTITIDGNGAKLAISDNVITPRSTAQITQASCCGMSKPAQAAVAAVSLGTLGFAGPISYEILTNRRNNYFFRSSFGYLDDGIRHEIESFQCGKRVILPGDETDGWFCFRNSELTAAAELQLPVIANNKASLIVVPALANASSNPPVSPQQ